MTRKDIMKHIEEYIKEIGIYSCTVKRYDHDRDRYETYIVFKNIKDKTMQFDIFVNSINNRIYNRPLTKPNFLLLF